MKKKVQKQGPLLTANGKPYDVPPEGSLGLLALGYQGLMAWRAKRKEILDAKKKEEKDQ